MTITPVTQATQAESSESAALAAGERVTLADLPLRGELRGHVPYYSPRPSVPVQLNANEACAPSVEVRRNLLAEIERALGELHRYPDTDALELRIALAQYQHEATGESLTWTNIWPANGSNEALHHLLLAFGGPGQTVLGFEAGYAGYPALAAATSTGWLGVPARHDLRLDCAGAAWMLRRGRARHVVLTRPHNPTGESVDLAEVARLLEAAPGLVIVDEAYGEYSDAPSAIALLDAFGEKLVVSRTLSKAFPFAGGRLGYLVGAPALVQALSLVAPPYHLSTLTQVAATALLRGRDEMRANVARVRRERDRVSGHLTRLGYRVLPSEANFLMFCPTGAAGGAEHATGLWRAFAQLGVLVRDPGVSPYLRVSIGCREDNDRFLTVAEQLAPGGRDATRGLAGG